MTKQVTTGQLKAMIVQKLNLKGVTAESLGDDDALFGSGLGLDSVDALELVLAIESEYGIQIQDAEVGREAFASARVLCGFINARLAGTGAGGTPAPREQSA
jgi:acyl carrier protein